MTQKKRFLALTAATIAALTTLTACGPSAELTQARESYEAASANWDSARVAFDTAVEERDEIIAKTPAARAKVEAVVTELESVVDAAEYDPVHGGLGADMDAVWRQLDSLSLEHTSIGITEGDDAFVPLSPQVPESKPELTEGTEDDYILFAQKLEDEIRQFTEATSAVEGETRDAKSLIKQAADANPENAYLADAPAVVDRIREEVAKGIKKQRNASITDGMTAAADKLQAAIDSGAVTIQNMLDALGDGYR
ncbi:hypothetical protein [uncultured Microbacterium sp.]|uniref:hypothetical protein n=1 Tax=uncultured Microbacterium sp. TaxID=191216 RepID=UPI002626C483|nr:hypothetical protein [uncultured Microbacterium sp.]